MLNINYFLLEVGRHAEASTAILRSMLMLPKVNNNPYVTRSIHLFNDMLSNINTPLQDKSLNIDREELKSHLHAVYECATVLKEMNTMLTRTVDKSKYGEYLSQLKTFMDSIEAVLTSMAREVVRLYGPREAMFIVTPGYQALSGIWKEYRKLLVKAQE